MFNFLKFVAEYDGKFYMPMVEFDQSDILRSRVIPPAWYRLDLGQVSEWNPSKDQQSNNCTVDAIVKFNADTGDPEHQGVPLTLQFNDKKSARGFIEGFLKALGVDIAPGRYDIGKATGMEIDAFVENETYEGRTRNRVNHKYRLPKK